MTTMRWEEFEAINISKLSALILGDSLMYILVRAHPSYTAFMSKWSLPVYFQIRQ